MSPGSGGIICGQWAFGKPSDEPAATFAATYGRDATAKKIRAAYVSFDA